MAVRFTFRQLEYFVAVCDAGSISAASERINVSSPSISTAISQLETVFGLELFVRQRARGLSLTPGGRRFYSAAKDLLDGASALHEVAGEISGEVRGPVSVGGLVTAAPFSTNRVGPAGTFRRWLASGSRACCGTPDCLPSLPADYGKKGSEDDRAARSRIRQPYLTSSQAGLAARRLSLHVSDFKMRRRRKPCCSPG